MPHDGQAYVRPFDRDRLMLVPRDKVMKGAMALLDRVQQLDPEVGVAATAVLFAAFCKRVGLEPSETWYLGNKMLRPEAFHVKGNAWEETIQDFAGIRIAGDRRTSLPGT